MYEDRHRLNHVPSANPHSFIQEASGWAWAEWAQCEMVLGNCVRGKSPLKREIQAILPTGPSMGKEPQLGLGWIVLCMGIDGQKERVKGRTVIWLRDNMPAMECDTPLSRVV